MAKFLSFILSFFAKILVRLHKEAPDMLYSLLESKRFQDYIKIPRVHKNVKENYYGI